MNFLSKRDLDKEEKGYSFDFLISFQYYSYLVNIIATIIDSQAKPIAPFFL
jgi:hypothetical protein